MLKKYMFVLLSLSLMCFSLKLFVNPSISIKNNKDSKITKINIVLPLYRFTLRFNKQPTYQDIINYLNDSRYDFNTCEKAYPLGNDDTILIKYKTNTTKVSINSNNVNELCKLPGIGLKTANKIIAYRNKYGDFKKIDELMNVKGIGQKKYAKIEKYLII